MRIERHAIDAKYAQELFVERKQELPKRIAAAVANPDRLSWLASEGLALAQLASVNEKAVDDLARSLKLSLDAYTAFFEIVLSDGKEVVTKLGDQEVRYPKGSTVDESYIEPRKWLACYQLSMICRQGKPLELLCQVTTEKLKQSSTQHPKYRYLLVDALRGFWKDDPKTGKHLLESLKLTDPEKEDVPREWVLHLDVPYIHLFKLATSDDPKFTEVARESIERHKAYWSKTKKRKDDFDGFLSLGITSLAALAHDRDLKADIDSPYVPQGLVNGMYFEMNQAQNRDCGESCWYGTE